MSCLRCDVLTGHRLLQLLLDLEDEAFDCGCRPCPEDKAVSRILKAREIILVEELVQDFVNADSREAWVK